MKLLAALSLAAVAAAAPASDTSNLERRQGYSSNDLTKGSCKGATFIWARGSAEPGNMGWLIGNYLMAPLRKGLNNDIAIEGVTYGAGILTNIGPGMADSQGISEATKLFKLAISKCPNTIIVGGGYSQGAAVMHRAIEKIDEATKDKITAMVLYGDTQYPWDGASIKGYPKDRVKAICNSGDGVCSGGITVTPAHLAYSNQNITDGANFLIEKIKNARANGGSPLAAPPAPSTPAPATSSPPKASPPKLSGPKGSSPKGSPPKASPPKAAPPPASSSSDSAAPATTAAGGMEGMEGMPMVRLEESEPLVAEIPAIAAEVPAIAVEVPGRKRF